MRLQHMFVRVIPVVTLMTAVIAYAPGIARADLSINYGTGTSSYSIMNIATTSANVVAQYYPPGGNTPDVTMPYTIPGLARQIVKMQAPDFPLSGAWQGSVVLSSDQDLAAAEFTLYTGRAMDEVGQPVGDQGTEVAGNAAFNQGNTTLFAPLVQRQVPVANPTHANLASRITVQNTSGSSAPVDFIFQQGATALGTKHVTLSPYGSITLRTSVDADMSPVTLFSGVASLVVSSTQALVGVVEQDWDNGVQNWAGTYAMLTPNDKATTLFSAQAQRECRVISPCVLPTNAANVISNFNTYSSFDVQNTTNTTAHVTANFIPTVGNAATYAFTIAPGAAFDINMYVGGSVAKNDPFWAVIGGPGGNVNFRGALKFVSDQPLVGVGFFQQPQTTQNYVSAYDLVSNAGATNRILGPWFDRSCNKACPGAGLVTDFNSFSNLALINVGPSATTITAINFYTQTGGSPFITYVPTQTIQSGGALFVNSRSGGDIPLATAVGLSGHFLGTIEVIASNGGLIKGVVTVNFGEVGADAYNAFNR
jgi:hypothetical protein